MDAPRRRDEPGCLLYAFSAVGAGLLLVGWFLGGFLLAPVHCGGPECETMRSFLNLSVTSAFLGIGCVLLFTTFNSRIPRILLLVAAVGAFAVAAVAGLRAGLVLTSLIDIMLMVVPIWLFLSLEPSRRATDDPTAQKASSAYRRYWLTMALFVLTWLAILFATLTVATLGR